MTPYVFLGALMLLVLPGRHAQQLGVSTNPLGTLNNTGSRSNPSNLATPAWSRTFRKTSNTSASDNTRQLTEKLTANIVTNATENGTVYITSEQANEIIKAYLNIIAWYDTQIKQASVKSRRTPRSFSMLKMFWTCRSVLKDYAASFISSLDARRLLTFPDTKWCGIGNTAAHKDDLGSHRGTDMCCREHDLAVDFIEPFSKKYGIWNMNFFPMTNCEGDQKFFTCLLSDESESSVMSACVGTAFFNVLGAQCFKKPDPIISFDYKTMSLQTTTPSAETSIHNFLEAYLRKH